MSDQETVEFARAQELERSEENHTRKVFESHVGPTAGSDTFERKH